MLVLLKIIEVRQDIPLAGLLTANLFMTHIITLGIDWS